ncbi:MAG: VWA domain-containing protein [Rhodobacterales bacterium]|nr:VWA domain-containing protein [Rhodobacterales bacterium]
MSPPSATDTRSADPVAAPPPAVGEVASALPWARVWLALMALAVDPAGLKGLWLRSRAGPVRDRVTDVLSEALPLPHRRLHPALGDEALYGGLHLTATLAAGRPVRSEGLLARPSALVLTMAERCPAGLAARPLGGPGHCLIALDEGAEPEEALPPALADRLALFLTLDGLADADAPPLVLDMARITKARAQLATVRVPKAAFRQLTSVALALDIPGLRAPLLALQLARVVAALRGHAGIRRDDLTTAAELVFAHRARAMPQAEAEAPPPPSPEPDPGSEPDAQTESLDLPDELMLEAVKAALPADLLDRLAAARAARAMAGGTGSGEAKVGHRRGRPLPSRPGRPDSGHRLDLIATLRAAAPWQAVRRREVSATLFPPPTAIPSPQGGGMEPETTLRPWGNHPDAAMPPAPPSPLVGEGWGGGGIPTSPDPVLPDRRLHIRPADLRIRRHQERTERVVIFAVDASGSAALARLAEAKGAVELLLARAYARRDHVALIAFRGAGADLVLPPTRSLVQTKRRLAGLPGGGGTPLAAALRLAHDTALRARARGLTPVLALLTDGRANVALDGGPGRDRAEADTARMARLWRATGAASVVIDTASRPEAGLKRLSAAMGGVYLPLPRADAARMSTALEAALGPVQSA